MAQTNATQVGALYTTTSSASEKVVATQSALLASYGPPATLSTQATQFAALYSTTAEQENTVISVKQAVVLASYSEAQPVLQRQTAWSFVLDGHRFYVLPLGQEGDWAYDTTTQEWCQLQTLGFDGLNFTHGVMWGIRIMGGDALYSVLLELDPNQPLDDAWRSVEHIVTGGLSTRDRSSVGVANFTVSASVGDVSSVDLPISLAFSDDQGVSWSKDFDITLTGDSSQLLIWNALGSFSTPGRVFRITDYAGPVRLDGADCVLTTGSGADSGQGDE